MNTMSEKAIEVLVLSEVRWPGHGVSQLGDAVIVHSGVPAEERHRRQGVAIVMREKAASAWRQAGSEFDPVSERILRVRLKSHTGFL